jgi:hypothetical protein
VIAYRQHIASEKNVLMEQIKVKLFEMRHHLQEETTERSVLDTECITFMNKTA